MAQAKVDSSIQVIPNYVRFPQQGLYTSPRGLAITYSFNQSHKAIGTFTLETIYMAPRVNFAFRLESIQDKTLLLKMIGSYKCHINYQASTLLQFEIPEKYIDTIVNQLVIDNYIPESLKKEVLSLIVENRDKLYTMHQEYNKTKTAEIEALRIAKEREDKIEEENRLKKDAEMKVLINALLEKDPKAVEKLKSFNQSEIDSLFSALEFEFDKQIPICNADNPSYYLRNQEIVAILETRLKKFEDVAQILSQFGMKYSGRHVNLPLEIQIMRTAIEKAKGLLTATASTATINNSAQAAKGNPPSVGATSFSLFSQCVENDKRFTKSNETGVLYEATSDSYITDEVLKKYGFKTEQIERTTDSYNIAIIKQLASDYKSNFKL